MGRRRRAGSRTRDVIDQSPSFDRLRAFAAERHATVFMVMLAGFSALLHRCSGEKELVVGSPVAGRPDRSGR